MQVIQDAIHSADLPYGGIATIGNYDGIHRGQLTVLERVVERARESLATPTDEDAVGEWVLRFAGSIRGSGF